LRYRPELAPEARSPIQSCRSNGQICSLSP
jgi:hypothetical protein